MRIIKKGTPSEEVEIIRTCGSCGTEFAFKEREITYHSCVHEGSYNTIECPVCSEIVFVYL